MVIQEENRKTSLKVAFSLILCGGFIFVIGYLQQNFSSACLGLGFSALSFFCLILIQTGRSSMAKICWGIGTPLLIFFSPFVFSVSQPLTVITYGYLYMGGMLFMVNAFHYKEEKVPMWISILLFFLGMMLYDRVIIEQNFSQKEWAIQLMPHYAYLKSMQAFHFASVLALVLLMKANKVSIERKLTDQIRKLKDLGSGLISISQNHLIHSADLITSLKEILIFTATSSDVSRVSIWEINEEKDAIQGVLCYDSLSKQFSTPGTLDKKLYPHYFRHLLEEQIIVADHATTDEKTKEFTDSYLRPLGIKSMMDSPFFIDGKFKGILCYEEQRQIRHWDEVDQLYSMCISKLISIAYYCQVCNEQFDEIILTNTELDSKNKALESINGKIMGINDDLALHVLSQEEGIVELSKFIEDISFKNSHHVRGPLSRILGLTKLYRYDDDLQNKTVYIDYIESSARELDTIVREITQTLRSIRLN
jgi:hypothetical protein